MKKIIMILMCALLLLCTGCGSKGKDNNEEETPGGKYKEIRIVSKDLTSIEELSGKVLAVQESFDKEYSDYVIEQLKEAGVELKENDLHWFTSYADIKFLIDDGSIDAWVIPDNREDTVEDYRSDYKREDYNTVMTYQMPVDEEKETDSKGLVKYLYEEPFMVIVHGLDGFGENSVHEWKYYRNDVNHILVVNPEKKHILMISIPRDTRIKNVATGYLDKFTHFVRTVRSIRPSP